LATFENKNKIALSHVGLYKSVDNIRIEKYIEDLFSMLELDLKEIMERGPGLLSAGNMNANGTAATGGMSPQAAKAHACK